MIKWFKFCWFILKKFERILVTGGAGYIGSVLSRKLIQKGYEIRILDSLIFGSAGILELISEKSVDFIEGDIRDQSILAKAVKGIDCVIHLASIVGEPLCNRIPDAARQINEYTTPKLIKKCKDANVTRLIFASTCSNYGSATKTVDETSPVNELSLYSSTKIKSESFVIQSQNTDFEPCVLRFATAFGLSPRMRFDLLLHEFIRDAIIEKKITVFGPNFWRPLIHIDDISNACILTLEKKSNLISGEIYNVGDNKQNYTKIQLAKMIQNQIPETKIEIQDTKKDPRNYSVSFDKITKNFDFKITKNVMDGIKEILDPINNQKLNPTAAEFLNISKMVENVRIF